METLTTSRILRAIRGIGRLARKQSRLRAAILVLALASAPFSLRTRAQQVPVLDLTKPAPPNAGRMPIPGIAAGAIVGGERPVFFPPRYKLPLEITIRGVRPPAPGARAAIEPKPPDFALELLVKNIGDQPFDLPMGRDPAKAHRPGSKRRRTFLYLIRPENTAAKLIVLPLVGSADASESVPDTLLRIEPQHAVLVLLPIDLAAIARGLPKEATTTNVRVVCREATLADDKYVEEKISEDVESQNVVAIPIR